jgi:cytochrome c oxidase subunit 2
VNSNSTRTVLIAVAIFVVIGIAVGLVVRVFPVQASAEAASVDALFNFMLAIAVVVFLIVEGGIIYSILRFRRKPGDETDGMALHGNTALEITWTAIPAVIVVVLSVLSFQVYSDTRQPRDGAVQVGAIGQQFQWKFKYEMPPDSDPAATPELREKIDQYMNDATMYLPVGRPVQVNIEAQDVLHAFYIPEFRIKQDAVPGRVNSVYLTPTVTGEWWVICAELCGAGHAAMSQINRLRVVEAAEYDKFVMDLYVRAKGIATDPTSAEAGRTLLQQAKYACAGCHVLDDLGWAGNIGPSLNGIATRAEGHAAAGEGLIGGTDAAAYIRGSILAPNSYLVEGYAAGLMPQNYSDPSVMPRDDLNAIINYLLTQR